MTPGDLISVRYPGGFPHRKGTIVRVYGDDDRYSMVKVFWHEIDNLPNETCRHPASWIASHCTILCKARRG